MKLSNIFKKESSRDLNSKNTIIQKLEKDQLTKVIGGADKDKPTVSTGVAPLGGMIPGGSILSAG